MNWERPFSSGPAQPEWRGWIMDFLMARGSKADGFKSGGLSVPLVINSDDPVITETGLLAAGTFGFTAEKEKRGVIIEARQGWNLFLPKESPLIAEMRT